MPKESKFFKAAAVLIIWGLFCANSGLAFQDIPTLQKECLSPRLNLSNESFSKVMQAIFFRTKIDIALEKTADSLNEIGKRNFKRELSPREMVVALAMILDGHSLRRIDAHFDNLNFVLEEFGFKKKPKPVLPIRILNVSLTVFLIAIFIGGFVLTNVVKDLLHLSILIAAPISLLLVWFLVGRAIDIFFWAEKKLNPNNKYKFSNPAEGLDKSEKEQYFFDIKETIRNIVINKFDKSNSPVYSKNKPRQEKPQAVPLSLTLDELLGSNNLIRPQVINPPSILFSSI